METALREPLPALARYRRLRMAQRLARERKLNMMARLELTIERESRPEVGKLPALRALWRERIESWDNWAQRLCFAASRIAFSEPMFEDCCGHRAESWK